MQVAPVFHQTVLMNRRDFIAQASFVSAAMGLSAWDWAAPEGINPSDFAKRLQPVGRALEMENYYVWCNSPIEGADGKIHIFFSRWDAGKGMSGWIKGSEIAYAVADSPEQPFQFVDVVLAPRPGYWDATTCHNPLITKVNGKYCLFYMGNSNGKTDTKRIGLAVADQLQGPWKRSDEPILLPGPAGAWDDHCTTNPAFIQRKNGECWLFYKSWNTADYQNATNPTIRGNRKYGLAKAPRPEGPYTKVGENPVIDFSNKGNNAQFEDAFVWQQGKKIWMIARDMGVFSHEAGLIMDSKDGVHWSEPKIAYYGADKYIQQPPPPKHLKRYGRFERPQILFIKGKPAYLFTTSQGGKYMTASAFIFRIKS